MKLIACITATLICALSNSLVACSGPPKTAPIFHEAENPQFLKDWGMVVVENGNLEIGKGVFPYSLNTPLFTDYAHKLRTIWISKGSAIYTENDVLNFPVGTVISKTFYYPSDTEGLLNREIDNQPVTQKNGIKLSQHKLIETRLLVHRNQGWEPLSYVWNDAQTEAKLTRIGAIKNLTLRQGSSEIDFAYVVPNINQCAGCHAPNNTTREIKPIGPKSRHLNGIYAYETGSMNQLDKLIQLSLLKGVPETRPKTAIWNDEAASIEARARAYIDINCAHCHNPVGPADTSGLHLNPENASQPHLGICKTSVAAGSGTGDRPYDITPGDPENSIMVYRMESRDPGAMMPELGRSLAHDEGVELIEQWILAMETRCE